MLFEILPKVDAHLFSPPPFPNRQKIIVVGHTHFTLLLSSLTSTFKVDPPVFLSASTWIINPEVLNFIGLYKSEEKAATTKKLNV